MRLVPFAVYAYLYSNIYALEYPQSIKPCGLKARSVSPPFLFSLSFHVIRVNIHSHSLSLSRSLPHSENGLEKISSPTFSVPSVINMHFSHRLSEMRPLYLCSVVILPSLYFPAGNPLRFAINRKEPRPICCTFSQFENLWLSKYGTSVFAKQSMPNRYGFMSEGPQY